MISKWLTAEYSVARHEEHLREEGREEGREEERAEDEQRNSGMLARLVALMLVR